MTILIDQVYFLEHDFNFYVDFRVQKTIWVPRGLMISMVYTRYMKTRDGSTTGIWNRNMSPLLGSFNPLNQRCEDNGRYEYVPDFDIVPAVHVTAVRYSRYFLHDSNRDGCAWNMTVSIDDDFQHLYRERSLRLTLWRFIKLHATRLWHNTSLSMLYGWIHPMGD